MVQTFPKLYFSTGYGFFVRQIGRFMGRRCVFIKTISLMITKEMERKKWTIVDAGNVSSLVFRRGKLGTFIAHDVLPP